MDQEKESTSGSSSGAVLTRAQSLRQRFADSRNADSRNSSSATLYSTVRWPQHQEAQASLSAVDASATAASASSNSKSPSPSRKTDNHSRRPSPKSWTNAGGAMTPPSLRSPRRPATPTAVACDRPGGAPSGLKDHSDDLQVGPYLKVINKQRGTRTCSLLDRVAHSPVKLAPDNEGPSSHKKGALRRAGASDTFLFHDWTRSCCVTRASWTLSTLCQKRKKKEKR